MKIEKYIPIPAPKTGFTSKYIDTKDMMPGDSFFVESGAFKSRGALYATMRNVFIKFGGKFSIRSVDGGYRVWRTK